MCNNFRYPNCPLLTIFVVLAACIVSFTWFIERGYDRITACKKWNQYGSKKLLLLILLPVKVSHAYKCQIVNILIKTVMYFILLNNKSINKDMYETN